VEHGDFRTAPGCELDKRRELGLIVHDHDVVHSVLKVFEADWATLAPAEHGEAKALPAAKAVKKVAKAAVRNLPLEPVVARALETALRDIPAEKLTSNRFEHNVEDAVRQAVEDAVSALVRETAEVGTRT
jgi:hypothetical protein